MLFSPRPIRNLLEEATTHLGELGGNLFPYFGYEREWEAEGKGSAPWASIFHLKLVKRRRKKKKIQAETLP